MEIEKLKAKLIESEQMYQQLKKSMNTNRNRMTIPYADTNGMCFGFTYIFETRIMEKFCYL